MRRLITISCLAFFTAIFLRAAVIYFQEIAHPRVPELDSVLKVALLAAVGGVLLAQVLSLHGILRVRAIFVRVAVGVLMGGLLFSAVFFSEHIMSTIELTRAMRDPEVFAGINGHCGVYSGRGLIRWYQLSLEGDLESRMKAFVFSNQCRIEHFLDLRGRQMLPCQGQEDALACLNRWMLTFSKRGYWNPPTRQMFFDEAQRGVIKASDADIDRKWISFAIQDYNIEKARPPMIKQAGIEEEFNEVHHYYRLKDEYESLKLTREIFAMADKYFHDQGGSPENSQYKDLRKEVMLKTEKIPELEEDLKKVRSKLSYNPSL